MFDQQISKLTLQMNYLLDPYQQWETALKNKYPEIMVLRVMLVTFILITVSLNLFGSRGKVI